MKHQIKIKTNYLIQITFISLFIILFHKFSYSYPSPYTSYKPRLNIPAKAWLILDSRNNKIIASKNANLKLAPASTTKIMTAYVIGKLIKQKKISLNTIIRISNKAAKTSGSRMNLISGRKVKIKTLLKGLLINSGNDAAVALAQGSAGSVNKFVSLMNKEAKNLGLKNTHFSNPNGLPIKNHYSSAKDLAILANALINKMPEIYKICSRKTIRWHKLKRKNTNKLLWSGLGVDGVKTGYTNKAKFCLVASAVQKNHRIITVLLGANTLKERFSLSEKMIKYGFKNS